MVHQMDGAALTGVCVAHIDRTGVPCSRCGTFRCADCLNTSGLCVECAAKYGAHAPQPDDTVGFGRRGGARIIDMVGGQLVGFVGGLIGAVVLVVLQLVGVVAPGWESSFESNNFLFNLVSGLSSGMSSAVVGAWLAGLSPGKAMLGLRVVSVSTGERPGLGACVVRELGYFIDSLFFGLVGKIAMDGSPHKQRYGDGWAGTTVVRRETLNVSVAGSSLRVAMGVFGAMAAQSLVMAAFCVGYVLMRR